MDGLSVAVNIIAVIQAANAIISICYDARAAFRDDAWAMTDVLDEISDLRCVLEKLERISSSQHRQPEPEDDAHSVSFSLLCRPSVGPLACCLKELARLKPLVNYPQSSARTLTKGQAVTRALVWRFKSREVKDCLQRIERCKSTLNLALTADERALVLDIYDTASSLDCRVEELSAHIVSMKQDMACELRPSRRSALSKWLCPFDPAEFHESVRQHYVPGTCQWLLDTPPFLNWKSGENSLLWLTGPPGVGKTVLMSTVVEHMMQHTSPQRACAYFYCDFRRQNFNDPVHVLRSIAGQLCAQTGIWPKALEDAFERNIEAGKDVNPTQELLESVIRTISSSRRTFIIVDALDECESRSNVSQCAQAVIDLNGSSNVFVASRPSLDIQHYLAENVAHPWQRIRLEDHVPEMDNDIQLYAHFRLESDSRLRNLNAAVKAEVANSLQLQSGGMFRWAQCQLNCIAEMPTIKAIRFALYRLPDGLDETYNAILSKIDPENVIHVRRILMWLAFSALPLSLGEIHQAIAIEAEAETLDEESQLRNPMDIVTMCGSLVCLSDNNELTLAHLSVRDYLLSSKIKQSSARMFAMCAQDGNLELAISCLTYLRFRDFSTGPCRSAEAYALRMKSHPFLEHAAKAWPYYTRCCSSSDPVLSRQINELLAPSTSSCFLTWVQVLNGTHGWDAYPVHATPLYYMASFGLCDVVKRLICKSAPLNARGSRFGGTALHGATLRGHVQTMEALLQAGADPNRPDDNSVYPLHTAAGLGTQSEVELLLDYGASYRVQDMHGETPLDWEQKAGQSCISTWLSGSRQASTGHASTIKPGAAPTQLPQVWTRQPVWDAIGKAATRMATQRVGTDPRVEVYS